MPHPLKIVVSGPVGAGKTTFVQSISETEVISTDEVSSEKIGKIYTTVAMDFGSKQIEDYIIYFFGTPGQERFDFMWGVLCEGALGLILLLDGAKVSDFALARKIFDFVTSQIPIPCIVGVTHMDAPRCWSLDDIAQYLHFHRKCVVSVDARDPRQALETLYTLFAIINAEAGASEEQDEDKIKT